MSLKKILCLTGMLAAVSMAGVLNTNDVKMSTTLGLGSNPAAIAVNKESKIELGAIVKNDLSQSNQIKNADIRAGQLGLQNGKNVNSSSFSDASKFLSYTDVYADNWFSVRYKYESNLYPNFKSAVEYTGSPIYDPDLKSRASLYQKDAVETAAFSWARELTPGLAAGVELAANIYTLNTNVKFNKTAKELPTIGPMLAGMESDAYAQSGPYYTLTLGGIYNIADNQKFSLSQKFSQDRGVYTNNDRGAQASYIESLPNETGLAYIYTVNNSLELAGVVKTFWGLVYDRNIRHSGQPESTETITLFPYNSYGFAASYKLNDSLQFQGYGNYIRKYKSGVNNSANPLTGGIEDSQGYNVSQIGGNAQYTAGWLGGGAVLLGAYVTKLVAEDGSGQVFDITNTSLSYSYAFASIFASKSR